MSGVDAFRYDGKRVLVVGGATGMGAAAAKTVVELGGEVIVLDYAPVDFTVKESIQVDLRDKAAVDAALDQVGGPLHAVFSAAGVADGTPGLMKINFIAHRHIAERLVNEGTLGRGGAICFAAGPKIAASEAAKHGGAAGLRALALQGLENLFDGVGHGPVLVRYWLSTAPFAHARARHKSPSKNDAAQAPPRRAGSRRNGAKS